MKKSNKSGIIELFNDNFHPENVRVFLEDENLLLEGLDDNAELSMLIFKDDKTLHEIITGKEKRFHVVKRFCDFFKVDIELFLIGVSDFAETLSTFAEYRKTTKSNTQIVLDARIKEQIRKELRDLKDRQLTFL